MEEIKQAAHAIARSSAILIATGAGMGVDSGLPDFRGNDGFWNAYPPFRDKGLSFYDLANPRWFRDNPAQAWGFIPDYSRRRALILRLANSSKEKTEFQQEM